MTSNEIVGNNKALVGNFFSIKAEVQHFVPAHVLRMVMVTTFSFLVGTL